jgi:Arc/MetJ-type ribon-helix-helix transcriptional regulator
MKKHWSDVLGNYVSASEVVRMAKAANETTEQYIKTQTKDLWGDDTEEDWDELARQVEAEAKTE